MKNIKQTLLILAASLLALPAFSGEAVTYYHNDLLGSPVVATDPTGQVRWESAYEPHGARQQGTVDQLASADNSRWYTDHVHDEETSLSYMQARYYDPEFGRFMAMDPLGFNPDNPASFNRYAYANNNPYSFVDPDGRNALTKFIKQTIKHRGNVFKAAADVADVAFTLVDPRSTALERFVAGVELFSPISFSDVKDARRLASRVKESLDPNTIRFSQSSVNGAADITASMRRKGYQGDAIDVVRMRDGGLTTLDNTRVLAASRARVNVRANVRRHDDALPDGMAERFRSRSGDLPSTYGEAASNRIGRQNAGYRNQYPNGSFITGSVD